MVHTPLCPMAGGGGLGLQKAFKNRPFHRITEGAPCRALGGGGAGALGVQRSLWPTSAGSTFVLGCLGGACAPGPARRHHLGGGDGGGEGGLSEG